MKSEQEEHSVISLETARRRRQAESRKARAQTAKAPPRPGGKERAINWRRVPIFLLAAVLITIFMWLVGKAGALLNPFGG